MKANSADEIRRFSAIHAMLHPKSIAIVGATERLQYGGRFLNNLLTTGCEARLYPVNPKREAIFGVPCYPSISALPEAVDLAAIIIPADSVLGATRECVEKGVRSAVVISAGFAELGTEEGRSRQAELRAIARESHMAVSGPNCLGLANVAESIWAGAGSRLAPETLALYGEIGLVSQSGATCFGPLITTARDRGVGFRYIVSTGNEADLDACDFLQYMLQDPEVKVLAALVEGFRDGKKVVQTAEMALEAGKPLVLLKVGRSTVGARAAGSHTAAMTGCDVVQDALFKQKGVVRVDDYDELIETANMFLKARKPRGVRVGVVSHSGGIGSFLADKCGEAGLELPLLSERTTHSLGTILGERGSAANPADVTGFAMNDAFPQILQTLMADENLDLQIVASAGGELQANAVIEAAEAIDKPVLFLWTGSIKDTGSLPKLQASTVPVFYLPGRIAKGVRRLLDYYQTRDRVLAERSGGLDELPPPPAHAMESLRVLTASGRPPTEHQSKQVLAAFGVPVTRERLCDSVEAAGQAAEEMGYPVVLKVMSPAIGHKTEVGAVRLNICNLRDLAATYEEMLAKVWPATPDSVIDGVLVQEMVSAGAEVIVGVSRDEQFGPVLMLGLGGVLVEALGAASWRVCPIAQSEAHAMIGEVKGLSRILAGYRGRPRADVEALEQLLVQVSRMAVWAEKEMHSLDINPLAVLPAGKGVVALDALVVPAPRS